MAWWARQCRAQRGSAVPPERLCRVDGAGLTDVEARHGRPVAATLRGHRAAVFQKNGRGDGDDLLVQHLDRILVRLSSDRVREHNLAPAGISTRQRSE